MLSKYFEEFSKKISRKKSKKGEGKESGGSAAAHIVEMLSSIIPTGLILEQARPVDRTGFSPDGIDFIAYKPYCADIVKIMNGYVPYELLRATYFVTDSLDKKSLHEALNRISSAKKLNTFSELSEGESPLVVPSFLIAMDSKYDFLELKNDIVNFYLSKNMDSRLEIDILLVMNRGLVIKNWREQRSFISLETKEDTLMWYFILMNEYLEADRDNVIDFRTYVKRDVVYKEY